MMTAIQSVIFGGLGLVHPLFAQEPKSTGARKPSDDSQIKAFFGSLDWWIWALVVALIVLIVVFVIIRKKGQED
ncbi:hypothetical protein AYO44_00820 [Planctomycetaceae bacterium SCGC AG-212-F19]|nr:hypothetical protein AYO44_00820 [Planctomycetaceae bacterium SCGC AG-212-F19]